MSKRGSGYFYAIYTLLSKRIDCDVAPKQVGITPMNKQRTYLGMDVHKNYITMALFIEQQNVILYDLEYFKLMNSLESSNLSVLFY